jgi:Xaa-Pro aminopeptidase
MPNHPAPATSPARISAGIPQVHSGLYWRIRFAVCDQVVLLELPRPAGTEAVLILRDIEMHRARQSARVDRVACPADFTPAGGLSGDRETANAQAAIECLRRAGVTRVVGDRSLPLIFADFARQAGITVDCDPDQWVCERRQKSAEEIAHLREAQHVTEQVMEMACRMIAAASARHDGVLLHEGGPLTSERVRAAIDHWLLDHEFTNPMAIIAGGPSGADCHNLGSGELRTGEPVIVDIFPKNRRTSYNGDCTRTVVHGDIPAEISRMHAAVRDAKAAAEKTIMAGVTGEAVHLATIHALERAGYVYGLPGEQSPLSYCSLTHGTGHGIGLDVHEPPLLDIKGPALLAGEVLTVEPGLYRRDLGGVRIEDMVLVTEHGSANLNTLPDGLCWK